LRAAPRRGLRRAQVPAPRRHPGRLRAAGPPGHDRLARADTAAGAARPALGADRQGATHPAHATARRLVRRLLLLCGRSRTPSGDSRNPTARVGHEWTRRSLPVAASTTLTPEQRILRARIAANTRWANEKDRRASGIRGQLGLLEKFA